MKNDEFHAKFTLRQHTPMIHFQADHDGALLRVSELKPAFDTYLRQQVFANQFDSCKYYLVGYTKEREADLRSKFAMTGVKAEGECSFDYKVKILTSEKVIWKEPISRQVVKHNRDTQNYEFRINTRTQEIDIEQFPCFFGELGQDKVPKHLTFSIQPIYIEIFSIHAELIIKIKQYFSPFLSRKNFGTRQSKGFGSFTCGEMEDNQNLYYFKLDLEQEVKRLKNQWVKEYVVRNETVPENEELMIEIERFRLLFRHIELFWRVVRSGFNKPGGKDKPTAFYIKPPLFYYLNQQGKQWDKKSIKQFYFSNPSPKEQQALLTIHPILYRDLLGLASSVTWGKDDRKKDVTIAKIHKPRHGQAKIDRFRSPVTFKPIRLGDVFTVYFFFDPNEPLPEEIYDQEFAITKNEAGALVMDTPRRQEFNLERFLNYVVGDYADRVKNYRYRLSDDSFITATSVFEPLELKMLKTIFGSITKLNPNAH